MKGASIVRRLIFLATLFVGLILCTNITVRAQEKYEPLQSFVHPGQTITYHNSNEPVMIPKTIKQKKRYFKASYISTINNIDFPMFDSRQSTEELIAQFKETYINLLDELHANHFNVVIFEVRPLLDAYYRSEINPWSQYLIGKEGVFIEGWDPLTFMVNETHNRNMEFHANINTFLVSNHLTSMMNKDDILNSLSPNNFASKHPDVVLEGKDHKLYLNPASQQVRDYLIETVEELVSNYLIDGIHITSSFYPPGGFRDDADFEALDEDSQEHYENAINFRESQINYLLEEIDSVINSENMSSNRSVQFGLTINVDSLYLNEDWAFYHLDYIIPMVNRRFEVNGKGYADLVREWSKKLLESGSVQTDLPNLYIGLDVLFQSSDYERELQSYLSHLQVYDDIQGVALRNVTRLKERTDDYQAFERVLHNIFSSSILLPPVLSVHTVEVNKPVFELRDLDHGVQINWRGNKYAKYYVLYRIPTTEQKFTLELLNDPKHIVTIIRNNPNQKNYSYIDGDRDIEQGYKYVLTVVDQANKETTLPMILDYYPINAANRTLVLSLLIITGVITLSVIVFSSYKVLKK